MLLSKKVAIITGGSRGIGKGIALKYADEGCDIAIGDIREKEANETLEEIKKKGVKGIFIQCDHTNESQVQNMMKTVASELGKIDILVNNAGGFGLPIPTPKMTEEEWNRSITLNLTGVFQCCKAVAPYMMEKKYGRIVNISSLAAIAGGPPNIHYAAAKGGVLTMTYALAVEYAPYINVNAILPGIIITDLWTPSTPSGMPPEQFHNMLAEGVILKRVGYPEDVARAALFYASELSDYVTGDRVLVTGGMPLTPPPPVG